MRKLYELTAGDLKKITVNSEAEYKARLAEFDVNKESLGKKFGLRKRNFASTLLRSTREYYQGKGQGLLDLACKSPYAADTNDSETFGNAFNLGYHTGYTNPANLRDAKMHNPNFAFLNGVAA